MERVWAIVIGAVMTFGSVASATASPPLFARLTGHWQCGSGVTISYRAISDLARPELVGRVEDASGVYLERFTVDGSSASAALYPRAPSMMGSVTDEAIDMTSTATGSADRVHVAFDGEQLVHDVGDGTSLEHAVCRREPDAVPDVSCANPNVIAGVVHAVPPGYPAELGLKRISGRVVVAIELDDRGKVLDAYAQSATSELFVPDALHSAILTTYRAPVRDCRTLGARFSFVVNFFAR